MTESNLIKKLEDEIEALKSEAALLRAKVKSARDYAGERCAAQEGLVLVHMLEKALRGES